MQVANPLSSGRAANAGREELGVLVFARAPVSGHCKSRLARGVGNRRAACLYSAMLEHALARVSVHATSDKPMAVTLFVTPKPSHPCFFRLTRRYNAGLVRQPGGDLGQRMHRAFQWGLKRFRRVVLIGTDQPRLNRGWLDHAGDTLGNECAAWLAPTHDGGFWALGLRRAPAALFRGQRWGSGQVAQVTRHRLNRLGLICTEWPANRDIDDRRDWQMLSADLRAPLARAASMPGLRSKQTCAHATCLQSSPGDAD